MERDKMKKETLISILLAIVWILISVIVSYRLQVVQTKMETLLEYQIAKQEELQKQEETLKKSLNTTTDFHDDLSKIREKMLRDAEEWINNREMER